MAPGGFCFNFRIGGRIRWFALLWFFLVSGFAYAQIAEQVVQPNFREADIRQVIEAVGELTGRNFLVDPSVNGQVTLISYTPMTPEALYQAFLSVLEVHGYAAVDAGVLTKIVPEPTVRELPGAGGDASGDEIVTQMITLEHADAAQLIPILRPLMPQYAHFAAHQPSNTLILADRAANVADIRRIVRAIDQRVEEEIEIIRLENGSATEIAQLVGAIAQSEEAGGGAPSIRLAVDARTNSLFLSGQATARVKYRALIAYLDAPVEASGATRVRYLKFAEAETLSTNLQTQFGTSDNVSIWAHPSTNALVLSADPRTMDDMLRVIDRLDIQRAQVQVDAIIVAVGEEMAGKLGITWAAAADVSDTASAGLTNFGATVPGVAQLGADAGVGALPEGLTFGIGRIRDAGTSWVGLLTALRGDAQTNIISTPTIVTLDNEEAEIRVGQEVPFLTGQFASTNTGGGSVNPFSTIQRQEVGTRLAITPRINEGTGIRLRIEQENSSISGGAAGAVDLVTNDRALSTTVFVEDGGVLVLGGMTDDQLREAEQRVPGLGRIPGIGAFFRARETERMKSTLLVFIRPRILRNQQQAVFASEAKYRYLRDLQLEQAERPVALMPDETRPVLPEYAPPAATDSSIAEPSEATDPLPN